jgi:quinolinate synthase
MKQRALELAASDGLGEIDPDRIEIYTHQKADVVKLVPRQLKMWNASCYVHEDIGTTAVEQALEDYPEAELLIHPECGCASSCMLKLQQGIIPHSRAYFLSTEQMIGQAKRSLAKEFIVATEIGMIYRLRREMPDKIFRPVSLKATCRYMKANTLPKLLRSLQEDRVEIVICDDCCDPERPHNDGKTLHIQRSVATKAKTAIDRMMTIGA